MLSGRAICRQIRPRILVSKRTFTHIPRLVQRNAVEVLSISSKYYSSYSSHSKSFLFLLFGYLFFYIESIR